VCCADGRPRWGGRRVVADVESALGGLINVLMSRSPELAVILALGFVVAIAVHEFFHAYIADLLGDPTPRAHGRVTLNPLKHLDPLGTILLIFLGFGWGKPVPVNGHNLRTGYRRGMATVALAGPLSNLLLAAIFAVPLRMELAGSADFPLLVLQACRMLVSLNIVLAVFNMIPIAPLDGYRVVLGILPWEWGSRWARYEAHGPLILMALLFLVPFFLRVDVLGLIIAPPTRLLFGLIVGV
jgi:Zn-dependent protease